MRRTSLRTRAVSAVTALAIAGGGLLALAPPASAAPLAGTLAATSAPTVYVNSPSETAGNFSVTALPAVSVGDTITIAVDDSDAAANCAAVGDTIGFASVPGVANTTVGNAAAFSVGTSSSPGACTTAAVKDVLTLTATHDGLAGAALTVSGVKYAIGSAVATGKVQVSLNSAAFSPAAGNAVVSAVQVSVGAPTLVGPTSAATPISNITFAELRPGAISATNPAACVSLQAPAGVKFTPAAVGPPATPAVTAGGGAVVGAVTVTPTDLSFAVTSASTTATTYTISGIKLDNPTATTGRILAKVGSTCAGSEFSATPVQLGAVGSVDRLAGSTRYATAQKIADALGACHDNVIVANGVNFPDALAASYLATDTLPILLVADTVPTETANTIRLHGVKHITIVGGPNSVSDTMKAGFEAQNATTCGGAATANKVTTDRIAGVDRFATAKAVSEVNGLNAAGTASSAASPTCTPVTTAILASGETFPDALAAGVLAASGTNCGGFKPLPLLLTNATSLNPFASQALADMSIKQVLLVGGPNTVNASVVTAVQALGITVNRIAGTNRQATAATLASVMGQPEYGDTSNQVLVTRGDLFPDALVGAPYGAANLAPLLLSDSSSALGATSSNEINALPGVLNNVTLLGGPSSLTAAVANDAATALASQTATP